MTSLLNPILILLIFTISILCLYSLILSGFASSHNNTQNSDPLATEKRLPPLTPGLELEIAPQPSQLSEEERFFLKKELEEVNILPPIPLSKEPIQGPSNGTATGVNATLQNTTIMDESIKSLSEPTEENLDMPSLIVIENRTLTPGQNVFSVLESSLSNKNETVFYTANIFTARSLDGAKTWEYGSPKENMPDACCDQISYYDPKYDIFIWYIQGIENQSFTTGSLPLGENRLKIGISNDAKTWKYLNFKPTDINSTWIHHSSDYPSLAVTDKYLYISMNIAKHEPFAEKEFVGPIVLRVSLDDLAATMSPFSPTVGPIFDYYSDVSLPRSAHSYTLVQGANDTMYWGVHLSNNLMRLYEWPDSVPSSFVKSFDRNVTAWMPFTRGEGDCDGPDGKDWCQRGQSKIRGAFMVNEVIGFLWDANKGGTSTDNTTFKYPYIDAATFNTKDNMTYLARPYIWSPDFAWMYGFASPDNQGNVGIQAFYGGGNYHPSIAAGVGNDFTGQVFPWKMIQLVNGTSGPSDNQWGDYITIRPYNGEGPGWIGSGWTLYRGSEDENILPRYFEFILENKNNTLSIPVISTKSLYTNEQYYSIGSTNFFTGMK